jgi:ribonuclease HI
MSIHQIDFYVDGACRGNGREEGPGRMGVGIVGISGKLCKEWSIPLGPGTNQKAELLAVREALLKVRDRPNTQVRIHTDSQYAIGCLVGGWKVKVNQETVDLVRPLIRECASFDMIKVRGHTGHTYNERADELAVAATLVETPE